MSISTTPPFSLTRVGPVMKPELDDPLEAWGVLNPASARKDGELYIFPRLVAAGNYSRIGMARVNFENGEPVGVERMGCVLEPETGYELAERSHAGVEDPRITWVEPLGRWIMTYVALSRLGPRIALAVSEDLFHWERLGLMRYDLTCGVDFGIFANKDGMFFPTPVTDPFGSPALALLHRPTYMVQRPDGTITHETPCNLEDDRDSIWIGYMSLDDARRDISTLTRLYGSELLALPQQSWEQLKIGGGTPPIRIEQGWLTFYHGVQGTYSRDPEMPKHVVYSAGALVLDADRPTKVIYRSAEPVLMPGVEHEQRGIVPNVVFPTAVDTRDAGRIDVYYGAADTSISVATTHLPEHLPE